MRNWKRSDRVCLPTTGEKWHTSTSPTWRSTNVRNRTKYLTSRKLRFCVPTILQTSSRSHSYKISSLYGFTHIQNKRLCRVSLHFVCGSTQYTDYAHSNEYYSEDDYILIDCVYARTILISPTQYLQNRVSFIIYIKDFVIYISSF